MRIARTALVAFALLCSSSAFAVNIVSNSTFTGSLIPWFLDGTTTYDPAVDGTGVPGSGSAKSSTAFAASVTAVSQCIATGPGNYTLSGKVFIPNGQAGTGWGIIGVTYFGGSNCSSGPVLGSHLSTVTTTGAFTTTSIPTVAPAGTTYAYVNAQHLPFSSSPHVVYFDDITLDNGVAPVPMLDRFAFIALIAILGLCGVVFVRR